MLFEGKLEGSVIFTVLIDNGATHNFIDTSFAHKHGLQVHPAEGSVACAGDRHAKVSGCATLSLVMQSFHGVVTLYVIDLPSSDMDIILGQTWLKPYVADVRYSNASVTFTQYGERRKLKFEPKFCRANRALLNATQLKAAVRRNGPKYFSVLVTQKTETPSVGRRSSRADKLVSKYQDVFRDMPPGLPPLRQIGHTIDTGRAPPVSKPSYRLSPKEKEEVERQVKDLLARGLIRPSQSPYGSPVLFVQEKDGSLRMCIDYRALNAITAKDKYPLPRIDDLLDRLKGAKLFTSLDLQSGYHQIRIADEDVQKTAIRTHKGLYKFLVLPFGLTNAPAAFQREMKAVFDHLKYVLVYLDDILIFSKSEDEHQRHLCELLGLLRQHRLYAKLSKCSFFDREAKFLGHVVGEKGIRADPDKVAAVLNWPTPRNIGEMRSFLGLANHLKRFIKDFSLLSVPLNDLTKPSNSFHFGASAERAFSQLKRAMSEAPVLAIADERMPYEVICDACGYGIGSVLMQKGRPIACYSYKMDRLRE